MTIDPDLLAVARGAADCSDLPGALADRLLDQLEADMVHQVVGAIGPDFLARAQSTARECRPELRAMMRAGFTACMIGAAVPFPSITPIAMN